MCPPKGSRGGNHHWYSGGNQSFDIGRITGRRFSTVCPPKNGNTGVEGWGKEGTKQWYEPGGGFWGQGNGRQGSWFHGHAWFQELHQGPIAWFQWVFLRLHEHEASCKWRRFCKILLPN